ncbi:DUF2815 family protein [Chitinophaga sp. CC14]|uniref:DUF2815 family protein n=1 Tax=Chitinophaga sp. CC14 TaxID=3029199 RepID=UPI003B7D90DB
MSNPQQATKVVIGPVRLSFLHIWEPTALEEGQEKKYSASLIIPKSQKQIIADCEKAINAAKEQGKTGTFGGKIPTANFKIALRDGDIDRSEDEAYRGAMFINASARNQPGIVSGPGRTPVTKQDDVYSGCYAYVSINFYPFNKNGNKGIAAGLNHIWKVKDGEPLGSRSTAESDFADVEVEFNDDDDFLN